MVSSHQDQTAARAKELLIRARGCEMSMIDRTGMLTCGYKSGNVGDVCKQIGAYRISDGAKALKVDGAWIGAGAANNEAGPMPARQLASLVVVNQASGSQAISDSIEIPSGDGCP